VTDLDVLLRNMDTGNIVPLCFAAPLFVCLVIRETRWRNRLNHWIRTKGTIVGFDQDPAHDGPRPILAYRHEADDREQIVEFNLYTEPVGTEIPIIVNPRSGEAFILTFRDRWFFPSTLASSEELLLQKYVTKNYWKEQV